ncbi:thrombospondin type 3 repeat-containing protein [Tahibacter harae]|uniref:Thrombospondin type 3 repeat-containing protein n=1 Tax=Tahibacter harae TaxID=2963937 RepID=A0ABT1QY49_9GAMM|nr:thrombospondin type 3 repeat-containing protein [Tahibacter harae]MCQ4167215.1 thrombospondin type 3 repeat-containing protein [Tahibacter harae]
MSDSCLIRLFLAACLAACTSAQGAPAPPAYATGADLRFEANQGQFAGSVDFLARGPHYEVALDGAAATLLLAAPGPARATRPLVIRAEGARATARAKAARPYASRTNYLSGGKSAWHRDVTNYAEVSYSRVYPGIDLVYYGSEGRLEFDFRVAPKADPGHIRLAIEGADSVRLDDNGDLRLSLAGQEVIQHAPVAYQLGRDGSRERREARYVLDGEKQVRLALGEYDRRRELAIDPVITYASYFGGAFTDTAYALRTDPAGNLYLLASTYSSGLGSANGHTPDYRSERYAYVSWNGCFGCADGPPGWSQVARTEYTRSQTLLVTKFAPDGRSIIYATYINGAEQLILAGKEAAVSPSGELFLAFSLYNPTPTLPLVNPQATTGPGWAARLNAAGNGFVYASYYPYNFERSVAVDGSDRLVVGASTINSTFPTVNQIPGQTCPSGQNMGVVRLGAAGAVDFAGCLGGTSSDNVRAVAVDASNDIYLFGRTASSNFPAVNPLPGAPTGGGYSLALVRIDGTTRAIEFSSRFGNNDGSSYASDMVLAPGGRVVIAGTTWSSRLQAVNAFQPNLAMPPDSYLNDGYGSCADYNYACADFDYYLASIDPNTSSVVFSTYFGGHASEPNLAALAVDSAGYIHLLGGTLSSDLPLRQPLQASFGGTSDVLLARFSPQGRLNFSTYIGGPNADTAANASGAITPAPGGGVWLATNAQAGFPVTGDALQPAAAGDYDVALARISFSGLTDSDGDGVPDASDFAPANAAEWENHDGDAIGDNADTDDDNDTFADANDRFPFDPAEHLDSDNDGKGDNGDRFPSIALDKYDFDNDGTGDNADTDADNDGVLYDGINYVYDDRFPLDASESVDSDNDGIGDNADPDRDNDGLANASDPLPGNPDEPKATFTGFHVGDTTTFRKPLPHGFDAIYDWDHTWTAASDSTADGPLKGYALTSRQLGHNETSGVKARTCITDELSFDARVSSAPGDQFQFLIDGVVKLTLDGEQPWATHSFAVTSGVHELRWLYSKNASGSAGLDAAWIDNVVLNQSPTCIFQGGFE